ncbi:thiol-disulfide oxidoreductase DCC family protein [Streptomonospora salina]|uniref:Putative DCC family thiol-disulfide oxidoreductase YuxK n=1 Tax=Streptomonospora salina TaxID=104205 RepID=A0A841EMA1_9ACTN|nr:DUF393 domain-containing protein [Streptomonospora salina]MBB6000551.1 putative DCC family thiol-disulfide oxidoreductase YuxK [Streptomonospora salina]
MSPIATQRPAPVLIFDGDCGFCTGSVRLVCRFVEPRLRAVPWQTGDLPPAARTRAREEVLLLDAAGTRLWGGIDAVAVLLLASRRPLWQPAGWLLRRAPLRAVGGAAYRWVARNRHRLPGGAPACAAGAADGAGPRPAAAGGGG